MSIYEIRARSRFKFLHRTIKSTASSPGSNGVTLVEQKELNKMQQRNDKVHNKSFEFYLILYDVRLLKIKFRLKN